jgi:hypothetical protein
MRKPPQRRDYKPIIQEGISKFPTHYAASAKKVRFSNKKAVLTMLNRSICAF